jgi:hypothetical protein
MKIQFRWHWYGQKEIGYDIGDLVNLLDEGTWTFDENGHPLKRSHYLVFSIKTLHNWRRIPSKDIMKVWPYQGHYMEPSTHLMNNHEWKMVPKSKIRWAKKKRGR